MVTDFVDEEGQPQRDCLWSGERFGRATDASVLVDTRLIATRASASVPVQIEDAEWNTSYGTLAVSASFTGVGATTRIDEGTHVVDRHVMWREGTRGWERGCTATATFDGVTVPGELVYCSMSRVSQGEVRVYHNVPSGGS